jgi:hypothetical protein
MQWRNAGWKPYFAVDLAVEAPPPTKPDAAYVDQR